MRLRRCTVEHPFDTIKYRIFGLRLNGVSSIENQGLAPSTRVEPAATRA
jgi:hypothetical protein